MEPYTTHTMLTFPPSHLPSLPMNFVSLRLSFTRITKLCHLIRSARSRVKVKKSREGEKVVSSRGQRVVPGTGAASTAGQEVMPTRAGATEEDGKRKLERFTADSAPAPQRKRPHRLRT